MRREKVEDRRQNQNVWREGKRDGKEGTERKKGTQVSLWPVGEMSIQAQAQADQAQLREMGRICP